MPVWQPDYKNKSEPAQVEDIPAEAIIESKPAASKPVPAGCCEYIGAPAHESFMFGRTCKADGSYCATIVFSNSKVWKTCPTRKEKRKLES